MMDGLDPNQTVAHRKYPCEVDEHDEILVEVVKRDGKIRNINFVFDTAHIICVSPEDAKELIKFLNEQVED